MRTVAMMLVGLGLVGCAAGETPTPDPTSGKTTSAASGSTGSGSTNETQGFTSGQRLRARLITGEDTSVSRVGFYDTTRKENCSYRLLSDGKQHCAPDDVTSVGAFADPGCSIPIAFATCGATHSKYAMLNVSTTCPTQTFQIYAVGDQLEPQYYSRDSSGVCSSAITTPPGTFAFLTTNGAIDPGEFVQGTESIE